MSCDARFVEKPVQRQGLRHHCRPGCPRCGWQGLGRGVGAYDLSYVLGGSMTSELRRRHEQELVTAYHEALMAAGVNGYDFDALWEDYAHAQLMGGLAVSIVTGGSMDLSNERARALIATMARRHVQAALDHDGPARLAEITG